MQNVNDLNIQADEFPTAETLKDLTATPEELFDKAVHNTKVNLMSTMVRLAKEQGKTSYSAQFEKETEEKFFNALLKDFNELGYEATVVDSLGGFGQKPEPIKLVTISWA